jgi:hypothetical protein
VFYSFKLYFRDLWVSLPLAGSILLQLFLWRSLIFNIRQDAGQIFLHYNIIFGVDLVGNWWQIYYLPATGILVILLNYFFSAAAYKFDRFLARFLSFWVFFFHVFLTVGVSLLVGLNS